MGFGVMLRYRGGLYAKIRQMHGDWGIGVGAHFWMVVVLVFSFSSCFLSISHFGGYTAHMTTINLFPKDFRLIKGDGFDPQPLWDAFRAVPERIVSGEKVVIDLSGAGYLEIAGCALAHA